MKLSYRGKAYEYNQPTLEVTEGEILGRYRGSFWRCHTLSELPVPQASHNLKYRGVDYASNPTIGISPRSYTYTVTVRPNNVVKQSQAAPAANELAKIHRMNLQERLERRLKAARERGDVALINLLEAERNELAL